jgi:pantoate--beta-alanine ligase
MRSRNAMLSTEDRQRSLCISRALTEAREHAVAQAADAATLQQQVAAAIAAGGGRVDYVEVVDAQSLQPLQELRGRQVLIAVAAFFGKVRLIDNLDFEAP